MKKVLVVFLILGSGLVKANNSNYYSTINDKNYNKEEIMQMESYHHEKIKINKIIEDKETEEERRKIKNNLDKVCNYLNEYCFDKYKFIFTENKKEDGMYATADGRIIINKKFYMNLSEEEKIFTINHEIAHVVMYHGYEEYKLAQEKYNIKKDKFNPKLIGEAISYYGMGINKEIKNLIESQEIEADVMGLIVTKMMGVDLKKTTEFLNKEEKSMLPHVSLDKRLNIIEKVKQMLSKE